MKMLRVFCLLKQNVAFVLTIPQNDEIVWSPSFKTITLIVNESERTKKKA